MALAIGGVTVEELEARLSHAEYVGWRAFAEHEPIGAARDDLHTAMNMLLLATVNKGKRGKKPKLEDFLIDYWSDRKRPEAIARKFRALTEMAAHAESEPSNLVVRGRKPNGEHFRDFSY